MSLALLKHDRIEVYNVREGSPNVLKCESRIQMKRGKKRNEDFVRLQFRINIDEQKYPRIYERLRQRLAEIIHPIRNHIRDHWREQIAEASEENSETPDSTSQH